MDVTDDDNKFGGMSIEVYDAYIDYLTTSTYPPWVTNADQKKKWRAATSAFSLDDAGLLRKSDHLVLKRGQTKEVLDTIHLQLGHADYKVMSRLMSSVFSYGPPGSGSFSADSELTVKQCPPCRLMASALYSRLHAKWKEVYLTITAKKGTENFDVNIFGIDRDAVLKHNEELEDRWAIESAEDSQTYLSRGSLFGFQLSEHEEIRSYLKNGHSTRSGVARKSFINRISDFALSPNDDRCIVWNKKEGNPILIYEEEVESIVERVHYMLGHVYYDKMIEIIRRDIFWRGTHGDFRTHAQNCEVCRRRGAGCLKNIPLPLTEDAQLKFSITYKGKARKVVVNWGTVNKKKMEQYNAALAKYVAGRRRGSDGITQNCSTSSSGSVDEPPEEVEEEKPIGKIEKKDCKNDIKERKEVPVLSFTSASSMTYLSPKKRAQKRKSKTVDEEGKSNEKKPLLKEAEIEVDVVNEDEVEEREDRDEQGGGEERETIGDGKEGEADDNVRDKDEEWIDIEEGGVQDDMEAGTSEQTKDTQPDVEREESVKEKVISSNIHIPASFALSYNHYKDVRYYLIDGRMPDHLIDRGVFLVLCTHFCLNTNTVLQWKLRDTCPIVVPSEQVLALLRVVHKKLAHCNKRKMYNTLTPFVYWHNMEEDCMEYKCELCDKMKEAGMMVPESERPIPPEPLLSIEYSFVNDAIQLKIGSGNVDKRVVHEFNKTLDSDVTKALAVDSPRDN